MTAAPPDVSAPISASPTPPGTPWARPAPAPAVDVAPTRRRRRRVALLGAGVVIAIVGGLAAVEFFEPHKLFIDERVNETLSEATSLTTPPTVATPASGEASTVSRYQLAASQAAASKQSVAAAAGTFTSRDHATSGKVRLVVAADGTRTLQLEDLATENGPDLYVALSYAPVGSGDYTSLVVLEPLKGNLGDHSYLVSKEVDLDRVLSVVIWCKRFSSAFGDAPLL